MHFELPPLPYPEDALVPHVSAETLHFHHGKHHAAYVEKLNELIADTKWQDKPLDDIIAKADGEVFNNAAQHWNHSFYWHCLSPKGGGAPKGALADGITSTWGSFQKFRDEFTETAVKTFGSGWAWLVDKRGKLEIESTKDADTPLAHGHRPLLTCDLWEHAYYIDHRNERPDYVEAFWKLVDWEFVAKNIGEPWAIAKAARKV